jgi:hypothetical protein
MSKKNRQRKPQQFANPVVRYVDPKFVNDFTAMIDELAKQSHGKTAIVSVHSEGRDWDQVIDVVDKEDGKPCEWGYQKFYRTMFAAKLVNSETYPLCVVVRTFTSKQFPMVVKNGKRMLIPGKQIRMFFLPKYGEIQQLSAEDCFACMNTDSQTGQPLPLDPTLEYVGV